MSADYKASGCLNSKPVTSVGVWWLIPVGVGASRGLQLQLIDQ